MLQERPPVQPQRYHPIRRMTEYAKNKFGRVVEHVATHADTKLTLLTSGRQVITEAERLVGSARHHANVQFYSFDMDTIGHEVVDRFRQAKKTNPDVEINVVVDNSTYWWNYYGVVGRKKEARERRDETFKEIDALTDEGVINGWVTNWFYILHRGSSSPFFRDHKKIVTADSERALVTSANIGEHHVRWRDIGVLLEGPAAKVIEDDTWHTIATAKRWRRVHETESIYDYLKQHGKDITHDPESALYDLVGAVVRNPSRRGRKIIVHEPSGNEIQVVTDGSYFYLEATRAASQMIHAAAKGDRVSVMTPYPGLVTMTGQMMRAAKKGVQVDLYIPGNNNYHLYNPENIRFAPFRILAKGYQHIWKKLLKQAGITVYAYAENSGMNHAKAVSVAKANGDTQVLIGSMNLNVGLFSGLNREIGIVTDNKQLAADFEVFLQEIREQSTML